MFSSTLAKAIIVGTCICFGLCGKSLSRYRILTKHCNFHVKRASHRQNKEIGVSTHLFITVGFFYSSPAAVALCARDSII